MYCGDYLVLSQDLYRPDVEKFWVGDYINFLSPEKNFAVIKEFANDLSEDGVIEVVWEDQKDFRGIKFRVQIQQPVRFADVNLKEKQQIDIYRSARFTQRELKKMITKLSFTIVQVIYGDNMDNALFILERI